MPVSDTDLSHAVSHALRHKPWLYEIELDEQGWAPVDQLLGALREKGGRWAGVDYAAIEQMIATSTKQRFELDANRIRARYGHSVTGVLSKTAAAPPGRLYHGTAPETWAIIAEQGLRPMRRRYVHLSADADTAVAVGLRKSSKPVLLSVDAAGASAAGIVFYGGDDVVWLADDVPPRFITVDVNESNSGS